MVGILAKLVLQIEPIIIADLPANGKTKPDALRSRRFLEPFKDTLNINLSIFPAIADL